jgi:hypothetical protein
MDNADAPEAPTKLFKRVGWRPKVPASPMVLEDSHLLEYRHPAEVRMLVLAVAAIAALIAIAVWFRDNKSLLAFAIVYLSMLITSTQSVTYNRLQGAEVDPNRVPCHLSNGRGIATAVQRASNTRFWATKAQFQG